MQPRLFNVTVLTQTHGLKSVYVLAHDLDEAMDLTVQALGPCELRGQGSRLIDDLIESGDRSLRVGGVWITSSHDHLIRPGAIAGL